MWQSKRSEYIGNKDDSMHMRLLMYFAHTLCSTACCALVTTTLRVLCPASAMHAITAVGWIKAYASMQVHYYHRSRTGRAGPLPARCCENPMVHMALKARGNRIPLVRITEITRLCGPKCRPNRFGQRGPHEQRCTVQCSLVIAELVNMDFP